jgi:Xaa-Pro aminopeptidase
MSDAKRTERLVTSLDGAGIDLMLVTNLVNLRYLTGFDTSSRPVSRLTKASSGSPRPRISSRVWPNSCPPAI